jgi:lipid A 3-O-deacylase
LRLLLLLLAALLLALPARAEDAPGTWGLIIENDSIQSASDRDYTHGTRLSYLCPAAATAAPCRWAPTLGGVLTQPQLDFELGQSIFTPTDIHTRAADRSDRPYGGWLYLGAGLIDEDGGNGLTRLTLQFGIVGPNAYAEDVQNTWHQFIGARRALGWRSQIGNEPGLDLVAERKWRWLPVDGDLALDVIPEAKVSLGNVFTYGAVGGMVRLGHNLGFDYGPPRVEPAQSGTDFFNPDYAPKGAAQWGWYLFLGNEDRVVGRDIFLDGNSFRSSRHVVRQPLIADFSTGAALVLSDWFRLAYSFTVRTPEFRGQHLGPDEFSAISLSARF